MAIEAQYGTQEWLEGLEIELIKLKECIKSWETQAEVFNQI